jgi:hypothetical protein
LSPSAGAATGGDFGKPSASRRQGPLAPDLDRPDERLRLDVSAGFMASPCPSFVGAPGPALRNPWSMKQRGADVCGITAGQQVMTRVTAALTMM